MQIHVPVYLYTCCAYMGDGVREIRRLLLVLKVLGLLMMTILLFLAFFSWQVMSWGNNIGDFFANTAISRAGHPEMVKVKTKINKFTK